MQKTSILTGAGWYVLFLYLYGCGPSYYYKFTPPRTAEGMGCVQKCFEDRGVCRQLEQARQQSAQDVFEANAKAFDACKLGRSKKDTDKYCSSHNYSFGNGTFDKFSSVSCEEDFNQCYQTCGGIVDRVLDGN